MRFLPRLLRHFPRAVNTDPDAFVAMRVTHPTGGAWTIADSILTLSRPGAAPATIALGSHTFRTLAQALADQGWTVTDLTVDRRERGAAGLLDATSPADGAMLAADSLLWAILAAIGRELTTAEAEMAKAPAMLVVPTATGYFLDALGRQYGIARLAAEPDGTYAARLVAEVLRPKSNNVAMAAIISASTGQPCIVRDITLYTDPVPKYDGAIVHDGAYFHNATFRRIYGCFDVDVGYDILSALSPAQFTGSVAAQARRLRAAGTQLRAVNLTGTTITDSGPAPTDSALSTTAVSALSDTAPGGTDSALAMIGGVALADTAAMPTDSGTLTITSTRTLDGTWQLDGSIQLFGGGSIIEPL